MGEGYSFWCSKCQVNHAGECSPVPAEHAWERVESITDLTVPYVCSKCGKRDRMTLMAVLMSKDGLPDKTGCPGRAS